MIEGQTYSAQAHPEDSISRRQSWLLRRTAGAAPRVDISTRGSPTAVLAEVLNNEVKTPTESSCWSANHKRKQYSINLNDYRPIRIFWRHKQSFGDVYGYITKHLKVGGVVPDIQTSEQIRAVEYQCARDDRVSAYALRVLVKNLGTRPK